MSTRERVQTLRTENPDLPASTIAEQLGVSKERVRQLLKSLGLPTVTSSSFKANGQRQEYVYGVGMYNGAGEARNRRLPPAHVGAWAEYVVIADLIWRGFDVFRSTSYTNKCDLIASSRTTGKTVRVECRSGIKRANGNLGYCKPEGQHYDVLAVVSQGGAVAYSPENNLLDTLDSQ
jgi:hypothetical protein